MPKTTPAQPLGGEGRGTNRTKNSLNDCRSSSPPLSTDQDVDVEILKVAQVFGVHTDRVAPIVDRYGVELAEAALIKYQEEVDGGFLPQQPFGYWCSLLHKGIVQAERRLDEVRQGPMEARVQALFDHYHEGRQRLGKGNCFCC